MEPTKKVDVIQPQDCPFLDAMKDVSIKDEAPSQEWMEDTLKPITKILSDSTIVVPLDTTNINPN